jgi:uncharacterized membrane protein (DUF106 family)
MAGYMAGVEENTRKGKLAIARFYLHVKKADRLNVENKSIYGSAFVMPQIARSAGYPRRLIILCIRGQIFLMLNCILQWMLVYSLMKEEQVMDHFAGQMWMCNFGAQKEGCPEADGCIGPGGTRITPTRLYSFSQWNARNFIKATLEKVFPEQRDSIDHMVDPGEYGLESQHCRLLCTFLFVVAVTAELGSSVQLLKLLWYLPNRDDSWVSQSDDKEVSIQIRGMPFYWKIINFVIVVLPKFMLWQFICRTGMIFLLETASIQNTIVNATALTFILNIDELLFDVFSTAQTKHMMEDIQGFLVDGKEESSDDPVLQNMSDETLLEQSEVDALCSRATIPWMFVVTIAIWVYFIWVYFTVHCHQSEDGTFVSNDMHMPKSIVFSHLSAFLPQVFPIQHEAEPYWRYAAKVEI